MHHSYMKWVVPCTLGELFERFEFLSVLQNGSKREQRGKDDLKGDLHGVGCTSMGRKKGSWLTWTKVLQRCVETPAWMKSRIDSKPIMLIILHLKKSPYFIQGHTHPIHSYQLAKCPLVVYTVTENSRKVVIINTEMLNRNKDVLGDYDFSRSDKFYLLRIPTYVVEDGVVLYEMHLKDLTNNEAYVCKYRFKELKTVH